MEDLKKNYALIQIKKYLNRNPQEPKELLIYNILSSQSERKILAKKLMDTTIEAAALLNMNERTFYRNEYKIKK